MKTSIKVSKELETIIQTERKLIDDISLMAMDSECRLFVGTEEDISVEEAMSHCQLPESVFEYQRETGCSYENIISLFDRATDTSNLISMFLIRVEGLEVSRHSNYQILTADYKRARNYIINETGRIEYEIAVDKAENDTKCEKALLESLVGHPVVADYRLAPFETRIGLSVYDKEIAREGEQVVVGNAVDMRFYNHYLEEKKQEIDNKIALLEKKIYMCLFNEVIDGTILYQDGHFIVGRRTSILINNLRDELEELQEDYDYEYRVKDMLMDITSLYDIYYLRINDNKTYYSFNRENIIKYTKEELEELKKREWEGTDLVNVNYFILDAINTNITQEIVHNLL